MVIQRGPRICRPRRGPQVARRTQVPNYGTRGSGPKLKAGHDASRSSRWSIWAAAPCACSRTTGPSSPSTAKPSAHFEHTVLITKDEPEILTWRAKDAIEVEGKVVELPAEHDVPGRAAQRPSRPRPYLRKNAIALHSHLARRQSYARNVPLRFDERANYLPAEVGKSTKSHWETRSQRDFLSSQINHFLEPPTHESKSIRQTPLRKLPHRKAQKRSARHLQERAPQAAARLITTSKNMPRLLGVEIPGDKRIEASLPYIYGIGPSTAKKILEQANIEPNMRAKDLTPRATEPDHSGDHREQAADRRRSAPRDSGKRPQGHAVRAWRTSGGSADRGVDLGVHHHDVLAVGKRLDEHVGTELDRAGDIDDDVDLIGMADQHRVFGDDAPDQPPPPPRRPPASRRAPRRRCRSSGRRPRRAPACGCRSPPCSCPERCW